MFPNIGIVAIAALIPLLMGFIYYNPKVLGTIWMKESGVTEEKMKGANMPMIFGVSFVMSLILAVIMFSLTVHQTDIYSLFAGEKGFMVEGSHTMNELDHLMELYGDRFRTFRHGALHGAVIGVFVIMPTFVINALFERKSFKYAFLNAGYWIITVALMGGVICQWG